MQKKNKALFAFVIVITLAVMIFSSVPAGPVGAATNTPTVTRTPTPTATALPPQSYYWTCTPSYAGDTCPGQSTGENGEVLLDTGHRTRKYESPDNFVGFSQPVLIGQLHKNVSQLPFAGRIYMDVTWSLTWDCIPPHLTGYGCWNDPNPFAVGADVRFVVNGITPDAPNQHLNCGYTANGGGECHSTYRASFPITNWGLATVPTQVDVRLSEVWTGKARYDFEWRAVYSTSPVDLCGDVIVRESNTYNIIPTIETPLGPLGNPADEQIAATVPGDTYRIKTAGTWNDGSAVKGPDPSGFSYSTDGVTWNPLSSMPSICASDNGILFEAVSTSLYIRVNDLAGEFANNTTVTAPLTYTLDAIQTVTACSGMFDYDPLNDWIGSGEIDAASNEPLMPSVKEPGFEAGEWYVLSTDGAPWVAGGENRYDIKATVPPDQGLYASEMSVWKYTQCWEYTGELQHKRYFFQLPGAGLSLWANHLNGESGSGTIHFNIYHVSSVIFPPADCESSYTTNKMFIDDTVDANASNGFQLNNPFGNPLENPLDPDWVVGNYYMLQTKGGPWTNGLYGVTSYEIQLSADDGATWSTPETWTHALCVAKTDLLGHIKVYFRYEGTERFRVRVNDTDFSGNMSNQPFEVWRATNITPPTTGSCSDHFQPMAENVSVDIPPAVDIGIAPAFVVSDGSYYMVETRGAFTDAGMETGIFSGAEISDDNGQSWYPWEDYPLKLCYETFSETWQNTGQLVHMRLYFAATTNRIFKFRADDFDGIWTNNVSAASAAFGVNLYKAESIDDPWNTCTHTYNLTPLQTDISIPSQIYNGVKTVAQPGKLYAIEIISGSWTNGQNNDLHYDAQIFADLPLNKNWYEWNDRDFPGWQCVARVGLNYKRIYFQAAEGAIWVRAGNEADAQAFQDNEGELRYTIYGAADINCEGPDCGGGLPPESIAGCYATLLRPTWQPYTYDGSDILAAITTWAQNIGYLFGYLGSWISYGGSSVLTFFLWCPEHNAMLSGMQTALMTREPVSSATRLLKFLVDTKTKFDSYSWTIGANTPSLPFFPADGNLTGAQTSSDSPLADLTAMRPNSAATTGVINPSAGDKIVFDESLFANGTATVRMPSGRTRQVAIGACEAHVTYAWGSSGLVLGFCTVMNLVKMIGLDAWLNLFMTIACIWLFFKYIASEFAALGNISNQLSSASGGGEK
jgi:hypothetical protein